MQPDKNHLPKIKEIRALLIFLKSTIGDEYRDEGLEDEKTPSMRVTIACNDAGEWNYQTGDNSYTGAAYSLPHWSVITLTRRDNCTKLARTVKNELAELVWGMQ